MKTSTTILSKAPNVAEAFVGFIGNRRIDRFPHGQLLLPVDKIPPFRDFIAKSRTASHP